MIWWKQCLFFLIFKKSFAGSQIPLQTLSLLRPLVTKMDNYLAYLSSRQEFCLEGSGKSVLKLLWIMFSFLTCCLCCLSFVSSGGYKIPVMFWVRAQAGNSFRLKSGTPHVVMANMTTATPIRFTPKPAFTWRSTRFYLTERSFRQVKSVCVSRTMSLICTWP